MNAEDQGWIASRFTRLSTGAKMLLILSLALFPLGLVAILASIQSAHQKNSDRAEQTISRLEVKAQRINAAIARSIITIETASGAIDLRDGRGLPYALPADVERVEAVAVKRGLIAAG